jgi:hypothetical protein
MNPPVIDVGKFTPIVRKHEELFKKVGVLARVMANLTRLACGIVHDIAGIGSVYPALFCFPADP